MDFFKLKRAVTLISVGLAVLAVALYGGTIVYRMASSTGGDITCTSPGSCYDTTCLFYFISALILVIIGYIICNWYCGTDRVPFEEKTTCRLTCLVVFLSYAIIIVIMIEMLCSRPGT
jgi:hypothetical protein